MGKWDRRYYARPSRRRKYQDYQWSPPRDEPCPDPETEVWQDNVPMWEKKFCYLVGRMPWKKVLSTKNFMNSHCHSNVLSWDDSAGKEAFLTAKKYFWEEFNGLPCETQLPSPNMYIDEIDWNPYIDPDLARECDKEYFNPDDKYFLPSMARLKGSCGLPEDVDDPWEHGNLQGSAEKSRAPGWGQSDDTINDASKSNKVDDPWESLLISENGTFKDKASGQNQWDSFVNHSSKVNANTDPWENHHMQGNGFVKDNSWGGQWNETWVSKPNENANNDPWENHQRNGVAKVNSWGAEWSSSRVSTPNEYSFTPNNSDGNTWRKEGSRWQDQGTSSWSWKQEAGDVAYTSYWSTNKNRHRPQDNGSYRGGRTANGRGNQWGQKPRDKYNWGPKDSINIHRGQGQINPSCRKREGPDHYVANYKGPRLQGDGQSSYHRNGDNVRRVSFVGQ